MVRSVAEASEGFIRGLQDLSWVSLVLALAVCSATLWVGTEFVNESALVSHVELFAMADDPRPLKAVRELYTRFGVSAERPMMVLIGGWFPNESDGVSRTIANHHDRLDVIDLCFPEQTLWESVGLADRLPVGMEGLAVIDASARRLAVPQERIQELLRFPRMPLRSRAFDKEVLIAGLSCPSLSGNFFWDNQAFFVRRAPTVVVNALRGRSVDRLGTVRAFEGKGGVDMAIEPRVDVLLRLVEVLRRRTEMNCLLVYDGKTDVTESWSHRCKTALSSMASSPRVRLVDRVDRVTLEATVLGEIQDLWKKDTGETKP